jgi:Raf kinase inhibitor-like YbhB/YbcL family protein
MTKIKTTIKIMIALLSILLISCTSGVQESQPNVIDKNTMDQSNTDESTIDGGIIDKEVTDESIIDEEESGALFWKTEAIEKTLSVKSGSFNNGTMIPQVSTCDSGDNFPNLMVGNIPMEAKSYAIIVEDPDAISGTFVHMIAWNIPLSTRIDEGNIFSRGVVGENDFGKKNYLGPCPPKGETHSYFFKVYALNQTINMSNSITREEVLKEIRKDALSYGEIVGIYSRNS